MDSDFFRKLSIENTIANTVDLSKIDAGKPGNLFRDGLCIGTLVKGSNSAPALLSLNSAKGLCLYSNDETQRSAHHDALSEYALRICASLPAGQCRLTLYDSTGMGRNLLALNDVDSRIKGEIILTDPAEFKRALERVSSSIPNVIQRQLGVKYKNVVEYNNDNPQMPVPYHFLFITDYPNGMTTEMCEKLRHIVSGGSQAGIFVFMNADMNQLMKTAGYNGNNVDAIAQLCGAVKVATPNGSRTVLTQTPRPEIIQQFDFKPGTVKLQSWDHSAVVAAINANAANIKAVKVSLQKQLEAMGIWSQSADEGISVPIGMRNGTDVQDFVLSLQKGEQLAPHHCLVGGATGSGKSVLLHNLICNAAWLYSPDELQFVLLDFKEGTEFKAYEGLPHARVLSVQSERQFGRSVLKWLDEEIAKRGEMFKEYHAQNLADYNKKATKKMPRILVVIDEFQKMLDGDASTTIYISKNLESIGRQGRSFGVHLVLATQSLAGVELTPATREALGLRISMRLNSQNDCDRLLGPGNHLPNTGLTRPGQSVYNSLAGLTEGNVMYQVAFLEQEQMEAQIAKVQEYARRKYSGELAPFKRFYFDGSAKVAHTANPKYGKQEVSAKGCTLYIGEPMSLSEEHLSVRLRRQNESNILIVGNDEPAAVSIMGHLISQIINQSSTESHVYILDKTNIDSDNYGKYEQLFGDKPNTVTIAEMDDQINKAIATVFEELNNRKAQGRPGERIVLAIAEIYQIRALRKTGYAQPEALQQLSAIIVDGSQYGIHTIVYSPSYNNLIQILDPHQMLSNFEIKIAVAGGESQRIFGITNELNTREKQRNFVADVKAPVLHADAQITKFKVYQPL